MTIETAFTHCALACTACLPLRASCSFTAARNFVVLRAGPRVHRSFGNIATPWACAVIPDSSTAAAVRRPDTSVKQDSLRGQTLTITTPIFYSNANAHLGSAYPTMAADTLARFYRLASAKPVFITGCDEHGEKIALAAADAAGVEGPLPKKDIQAFCDGISITFQDLWKDLDIQYDRFARTTSVKHAVIVKEFMERVWANGDIYKDVYKGLYCTGCEEYKESKDLIEDNVCPMHLKPCQQRNEENYFFALTKYQAKLEEFHRDNPDFVQPPERRNEVLGWVTDGLRDFSVSRANNPWGIPIPRDESHTVYVWFDALLSYVSSLLEEGDPVTLDAAISRGWPADTHIIGKDILRFHAIYWPAMLLSAGLPLPRRVMGHGFLTKDGLKMGKSLGNTLDPVRLVATYGSDAVRYYFMRGVDFGRDGDFSEERFINLVNADLANSFGNLLNRSVNLLVKNCDGSVPIHSCEIGATMDPAELALRAVAEAAASNGFKHYSNLDYVAAAESILALCATANAYIDRVAPWTAFKSDDPAQIAAARRCIVAILEATRIVAVGLSPITPKLSRSVYKSLSLDSEFDALEWATSMAWGRISVGMTMVKPTPVFPRLEFPELVIDKTMVALPPMSPTKKMKRKAANSKMGRPLI
jgi:methionyl-tRNA synthetase